jgi:predicted acylesterase/phospholipase RssA
VSTNLTASRVHVHRRGNVATAIRATTAIPGVMPPVPMGDELLIDGGVLDNLPIDIGRAISPGGLVIASDVTPPGGPQASRDYGLFVSGWKALRARLRRRDHGYPGISTVLMRSMITASMRERRRQLTSGMADCYLELDVQGVSMLDFGDPRSVAQRGYETAMPALTAWLEERDASG